MKKALLSLLLFTGAAQAQFVADDAKGAPQGGVHTVEQAKQLSDDTRVVLEGNIVSRAGKHDDEYVFQDASGSVRVEIDDEVWENRPVNPETKVRIWGEVEKKRAGKVKIDVDRLEVL